jgi:hypothetical protein
MSSFVRPLCAALIGGALLVGCAANGASSPALSSARPNAGRTHSWMLPEAINDNLLYVSDQSNGVMVYTYPPGGFKFVGMLNGVTQPMGECVDKAQDVWVTENTFTGNHLLFEYAHGGTDPIATRSVPGTPIACSVDGRSGDLAVVEYPPLLGDKFVLSIFRNAGGKPINYTNANSGLTFCAYDHSGDLFVDGSASGGKLNLAELAKGQKSFSPITIGQTFKIAGALQWTDKYLAIGDYGAIYRFSIDGDTATEVSSTQLTVGEQYFPGQFTIDGARAVVPYNGDDYSGFVNLYRFPAGGTRTRTLRNFSQPYAAVISRGAQE